MGAEGGDGRACKREEAVAQAAVGVGGADQSRRRWLVPVEVRADEPGDPPSVVPRLIDAGEIQCPRAGRTAIAGDRSGEAPGDAEGPRYARATDDRIHGLDNRFVVAGERKVKQKGRVLEDAVRIAGHGKERTTRCQRSTLSDTVLAGYCAGVRRATVLSVMLCPLIVLSGCSSDAPDASPPGSVRLYGADGNMKDAIGEPVGKAEPGLLTGMKGTTPLTPLTQAFIDRLHTVDGKLQDYAYAGEAYDAVVIMALATQLARTTESRVVKNYINGVTIGGKTCTDVAECLDLARAGTDLQYRGVTVKAGFKDAGEPSTTSYATLVFNADSRISTQLTEYVGAGSESAASTEAGPAPVKTNEPEKGAPLIIGGLTSITGTNAATGPAERAGAKLAVKEINAADGVLGEDVQFLDGDDGTDIAKAKATLGRQIADGAQMFLGPSGSAVAKDLIPEAKARKVILFAPSATSTSLTGIDDDGYFFRTAPSDELQARALADIIMRDGPRRVSIVYRNDAYGEGLQKAVRQELVRAGVEEADLQPVSYEVPANAADLQIPQQAARVKEFAPEAILVIGLAESAYAILGLATAGVDIDPRLS